MGNPWGLTVDLNGHIIICDQEEGVVVFSNQGQFLRRFGRGPVDYLESPLTPALDKHGNLYVSEYSGHSIKVFG